MSALNKTQQYRLDHHLCIDCCAPLYASEYNRGIARCERCRAKFLGKPQPEEPKAPAPEIAARMNRIAAFRKRVARCTHCEWASYPGNNVLFCLMPYCVKVTEPEEPDDEPEEAAT